MALNEQRDAKIAWTEIQRWPRNSLSLSPEKIVKLINFVCGKADEKFMFTSMLRSISLKIFYEKKT